MNMCKRYCVLFSSSKCGKTCAVFLFRNPSVYNIAYARGHMKVQHFVGERFGFSLEVTCAQLFLQDQIGHIDDTTPTSEIIWGWRTLGEPHEPMTTTAAATTAGHEPTTQQQVCSVLKVQRLQTFFSLGVINVLRCEVVLLTD